MKQKLAGILLLVAVILSAGGYAFYSVQSQVTVLDGYLGGEKIGLLEDQSVEKILKKKYHIKFDYSKAGSLDMVTADQEGKDYLFPSSQTALSFYEDEKDKRRSAYYHYYTGEEWRDVSGYDLCLDSSKLGEDGCAEKICKLLELF